MNQHRDQPACPVTPRASRSLKRRQAIILGLTLAGATLGALSIAPSRPALVWNLTESVPPGLYRIDRGAPATGDFVAIEPSGLLAASLTRHSILPAGRLLLKPLAATRGDRVCRNNLTVSVNGKQVATAKERDADGRLLPSWSGCRQLTSEEIFVLSRHPGSFDSRYVGLIPLADVVGVARPVFSFASTHRGDL